MLIVTGTFGALIVAALWFQWFNRSNLSAAASTPEMKAFQKKYLSVFGIMMLADWLQGPYVYALYDYYGFSREDIGKLFVAGFSSSMILGTFVGALADRVGRRAACVAYGILYSLSCVTKHWADYQILMVGRVLGGVATSLLFTSFESWMVDQHRHERLPEEGLSDTFSLATLINGIVAVGAGLIAAYVAEAYGYVAPFDASMIFLVIGTIIVISKWEENYGEEQVHFLENWTRAFHHLRSDAKITFLGVSQSFFEGSMYVFVFMWTPALGDVVPEGETMNHGIVFASFMVAVMIGSSLFKVLMDHSSVETFMLYVYAVSAASLSVPLFTSSFTLRYCGFLLFEVCVGIFWPGVGVLRGQIISEDVRATMMNIFRVPLNILVVLMLTKGNLMGVVPFSYCMLWLAISLGSQYFLRYLMMSSTKESISKDGKIEVV